MKRWVYREIRQEGEVMRLSPLWTMIITVLLGIALAAATGQGVFFLCFAALAPLMAVSAKRSEDRRHQKETERLFREIVERK